MPLSKAAQEKLLKALKIPDEDIAKVMAYGEFDIELPNDIHILSGEELEETKTRVKKGHENAYPEIHGKLLNEKHQLGLSTTEAKDLDKVYAAMAKKAVKDANIEPDKKVEALNKDLEILRLAVDAEKAKTGEWEAKYKQRELDDKYDALIPDDANKFLTKEEHRNRLKKEIAFGENGEVLNAKTNEPYKDALAKARKVEDVVNDLYTNNEGWKQPEGAFGGGAKGKTFGVAGAAGAKPKGSIDHDAIVEELSSKYDRNTLDGSQKFQEAYTTRILEADKTAA